MNRFRFIDRRILLVAGLVVLILLMSDYAGRVNELHRLTDQRSTVAAQVTHLAATEQVLTIELAYATSVAAVDQWARESGHMIKPGDVPIFPEEPANSTPVPPVVQVATVEAVPNWQVWYTLFLGK